MKEERNEIVNKYFPHFDTPQINDYETSLSPLTLIKFIRNKRKNKSFVVLSRKWEISLPRLFTCSTSILYAK